VEYKNSNGEIDETKVNNCDKWIFFGDTMSRGKKMTMYFTTAV
jgi:hypothetical protein